jgi:hypothetical protein
MDVLRQLNAQRRLIVILKTQLAFVEVYRDGGLNTIDSQTRPECG